MEKMIYKHEINRLTGEEKATLIYALNEAFDSKLKVDIDTVTAYKRNALVAKLRAAKEKVKPEHSDFFINICRKLGVDV